MSLEDIAIVTVAHSKYFFKTKGNIVYIQEFLVHSVNIWQCRNPYYIMDTKKNIQIVVPKNLLLSTCFLSHYVHFSSVPLYPTGDSFNLLKKLRSLGFSYQHLETCHKRMFTLWISSSLVLNPVVFFIHIQFFLLDCCSSGGDCWWYHPLSRGSFGAEATDGLQGLNQQIPAQVKARLSHCTIHVGL